MRPIQASGDERRAIMHQRASGVTVSGLIAVSPRPFISSSPQAPSQGGALLGSPTLTCSPLCDARQFHHAIGDSPTLLLQAPRAWTRTGMLMWPLRPPKTLLYSQFLPDLRS